MDRLDSCDILLGYAFLSIIFIIFITQLYLAFCGNIIGFAGAFIALVCGYSIYSIFKKYEE